jgi:hypothetical protein
MRRKVRVLPGTDLGKILTLAAVAQALAEAGYSGERRPGR